MYVKLTVLVDVTSTQSLDKTELKYIEFATYNYFKLDC